MGKVRQEKREEFFRTLEAQMEFWLSDKVDHAMIATAIVEDKDFIKPTCRDRVDGAIFSTLVAIDDYCPERGELHSEWARREKGDNLDELH